MIPPNYIQKQTLKTMAQAPNVLQNALAEQDPNEREHTDDYTTPDRPITTTDGPPQLPHRLHGNEARAEYAPGELQDLLDRIGNMTIDAIHNMTGNDIRIMLNPNDDNDDDMTDGDDMITE
jgi:hypothetical protein